MLGCGPITDLFDDAGEELLLETVKGDDKVDECDLDTDGRQVVRVAHRRRHVQAAWQRIRLLRISHNLIWPTRVTIPYRW